MIPWPLADLEILKNSESRQVGINIFFHNGEKGSIRKVEKMNLLRFGRASLNPNLHCGPFRWDQFQYESSDSQAK